MTMKFLKIAPKTKTRFVFKAFTYLIILLLLFGCVGSGTPTETWKENSNEQSALTESDSSGGSTLPNGQVEISHIDDESDNSNNSEPYHESVSSETSSDVSNNSSDDTSDSSSNDSSSNDNSSESKTSSHNSDTTSERTDNESKDGNNKKVIYLTFDDGPSKKNTDKILEILDKYDIKATFYIVGNSAKYNPEIVKDVYNAGHKLGCHSMTHDLNKVYKSGENFAKDLDEWEATIKNIIGELPDYKLYRFPGGSNSSNRNGAASDCFKILNDRGYYIYDWSAANCDKWLGEKRPNESYEDYLKRMLFETIDICQRIKNRPCIVLMHETVDESVEMLDWALEKLTKEGYNFDTLDNLNSNYTFVNYS